NKDLKPENGWSGEIGIGYSPTLNGPVQNLQSEITLYTSKINELIQWVPTEEESYWHVINTSKVRNSGIEATASLNINWNNLNLDFKSVYNYTRSANLNKENPSTYKNQLRYTPFHTLKNSLLTNWNDYTLGTNINYTGKRYSSADNSRALEPYSVLDVFIKKQLELKNFDAQLKLSVKNIFDQNYQVIAYHPMPGRAYYINLKIKLNKLIN
ncbi:MAG: TonB-dependent receptor domain-containing protein, partial [Bacteroidota bacterium]